MSLEIPPPEVGSHSYPPEFGPGYLMNCARSMMIAFCVAHLVMYKADVVELNARFLLSVVECAGLAQGVVYQKPLWCQGASPCHDTGPLQCFAAAVNCWCGHSTVGHETLGPNRRQPFGCPLKLPCSAEALRTNGAPMEFLVERLGARPNWAQEVPNFFAVSGQVTDIAHDLLMLPSKTHVTHNSYDNGGISKISIVNGGHMGSWIRNPNCWWLIVDNDGS